MKKKKIKKSRRNPDRIDKTNSDNIIEVRTPIKECNLITFDKYIGQTVTVYINAGGAAGNGFTGILISCGNKLIKLLVYPSSKPSCALGASCPQNTPHPFFCSFCPYAENKYLGTLLAIPAAGIIAFVHNIY